MQTACLMLAALWLLAGGVQQQTAAAEGEQVDVSSRPVAALQPGASAQEVVGLLLEAVADEVAAVRGPGSPAERTRLLQDAQKRVMALAAREAILEQLEGVFGKRLAGRGVSLDQFADQVIRSWPRVLSYYVGQWRLERVVLAVGEAAGGAKVYLPIVDAAGQDEAWLEVALSRAADGRWGVVRVRFRPGSKGSAWRSKGRSAAELPGEQDFGAGQTSTGPAEPGSASKGGE